MGEVQTLEEWIDFIFDHPIDEPESRWYFGEDGPQCYYRPEDFPKHIAGYIAETFERGSELLARSSDEQLDQGFWFLVSQSGSGLMHSLVDPEVPLETRLRALKSFVPLFEQVLAMHCSPHLSKLDEQPANPLNSVCYMWWDILPFRASPEKPERAAIDAEVFVTLRRLLAVPHDACRESALHGIGHWVRSYPQFADIIDDFLANTPGLRPELIAYAERARAGKVL